MWVNLLSLFWPNFIRIGRELYAQRDQTSGSHLVNAMYLWVSSFLCRGFLRAKEEKDLSKSPTWSLAEQPRWPICQPELLGDNYHHHRLQSTSSSSQPQRHKCRSPAGMQSTRGISIISLHSTTGEIQDGPVLMKLFAGRRSPVAFPHGNWCAVMTRLVFSWEHPLKLVLLNANGATELSSLEQGSPLGKILFLQVGSD